MRVKFEVVTHRDKAGNWVAQLLFGGRVIHEQHGPVSESQAVSNVVDSFGALLSSAIDREDDRLLEDAE